jgi:hypothetical protein
LRLQANRRFGFRTKIVDVQINIWKVMIAYEIGKLMPQGGTAWNGKINRVMSGKQWDSGENYTKSYWHIG